ncbi:PA14 domain-containing protein [Sulfitobacter sp. D35]|uniref:PA14 domain-containing protein n=1 Tax=Sulfitobacter sp. D35 TaxID=3083252 RepID=UPI00296EAB0A|nr:PA14 domain-containing protein [Sulfitobacter sp. D35]MDW4496541.1 PA14 domain-containing protein [Sulfitobacter sp. D35]
MTNRLTAAVLALALALPGALAAAPKQLTPANPQPGSLSPGLAVNYAIPNEVRTLYDAQKALEKRALKGDPLVGLSYKDTSEGDPVLTTKFAYKVAAHIKGYIRFDAPGEYKVNFLSNDGVRVNIGGQQVAEYDDIHACEATGWQSVQVPQAGWYEIETLYFQRKGTSCLMMQWQAPGQKASYVPNSAFGH